MSTYLLIAEIIVLVIGCIPFWQIWRYLHREDTPEDEPLGEDGVQYITRRLTVIQICAIAEAILLITQAISRFVEGL